MPIRDVAAQNASLDNDYGATHGSNSPSSHLLALFAGDPTIAGVELASTGGYARVTVANDATWAASVSGLKTTVAPVAFAAATAAWSDTATHWALLDSVGVMWDCARLSAPITVTAAGPVPTVSPEIFFESWLGV